eukprot:scaffold93388_cov17-Tisochrysis_lutea.AAC.2
MPTRISVQRLRPQLSASVCSVSALNFLHQRAEPAPSTFCVSVQSLCPQLPLDAHQQQHASFAFSDSHLNVPTHQRAKVRALNFHVNAQQQQNVHHLFFQPSS